jgi:RimJ/RimL family protein N-acetyltransferase
VAASAGTREFCGVFPVFLEAPLLFLRELRSGDALSVWQWVGDPDAVRHVPLGPFDPAGAVRYVEQLIAEAKRVPRESYTLGIVERASSELVGTVALSVDSRAHRRAELGYILRRDVWGRGLATEAAGLMVDFAIEHLGMNRVWAVCDPENGASGRVLEKIGMRHEGTLRQDLLVHGVWRDSKLYATLAADRAVRDAYG